MADLKFEVQLLLPDGWKFGSAMPVVRQQENRIEFDAVSLETLVDSPLMAGRFFKRIDLGQWQGTPHWLNLAADSAAALDCRPEILAGYSNLVREANTLFGAHHYQAYHFLLTLSDEVAHFGLEHHQSSDNRAAEFSLVKDEVGKSMLSLLPHEMTHSWNGKYRRPAGLISSDFQQSWDTELLWVYEGLTTYLGEVLNLRAGLWTEDDFHQYLALVACEFEHRAGRKWRPLLDTASSAQLLYFSRPEGRSWRRDVDFYEEGLLLWLEADVRIRQITQDQQSLDSFCQRFCGGESGPPQVRSYTLEDVLSTLNEIAPYDWKEFFRQRVDAIHVHAPLGGVVESGWRLVYKEEPSALQKVFENDRKHSDLTGSIGMIVGENGVIEDVIPGLAAAEAGLAGGMKLLAVNGRRWTADWLAQAVKATKAGETPLELIAENGDYFKTARLSYRDGARYPHLERDETRPDRLHVILAPRARKP
jgi:predicted metalloprotease with PDZ domain